MIKKTLASIAASAAFLVFALAGHAATVYGIATERTAWNEIAFSVYSAPADTPLTALWKFGDGAFEVERTVRHRYPRAGDYPVSLEVTTPDGRTQKFEQIVSISFFQPGNPRAWFVAAFAGIILAGSLYVFIRSRRRC